MKKNEVRSYLQSHHSEAIDLLKEMLQTDTSHIGHGIDGREEKGQLLLKRYLEDIGFETKLIEPEYARIGNHIECSHGHNYKGRPNLIGMMKGAGGGKSLILNGHMDTMAAGDLDGWKFDPWSAHIHEGNMYGVGACDMKAGLAAMAFAVKAVRQFCSLKGDIVFQSVVDEEGGGNGTLDLAMQGYTADGAIIAEPTELNVMIASRGVLVSRVEVTGEAGHPNYKWEKSNAIENGIKVWNALHELEHRWLATKNHPLLPKPTITIGKIEGGVAATAVPDTCSMYYDVEFLPEEYGLDGSIKKSNGLDVQREINEVLKRVAMSDEWMKDHPPEFFIDQHVEPHSVEREFPLIDILANNHGGATVSAFPAGCDARHLAQAGIKTLIYGPGSMADAHKANEKVSIEQYLKCIETIALTILDWCEEA